MTRSPLVVLGLIVKHPYLALLLYQLAMKEATKLINDFVRDKDICLFWERNRPYSVSFTRYRGLTIKSRNVTRIDFVKETGAHETTSTGNAEQGKWLGIKILKLAYVSKFSVS